MLPLGGLKGWTTNIAVLEDAADDPRLRPIDFPAAPSQALDVISGWADSQSQWNVESSRQNGESIRMHLTRTTWLFQFVDDMHLELTPISNDDGGVVTHIIGKSQSRVGKGDLGQNARNLIKVRGILNREAQNQ